MLVRQAGGDWYVLDTATLGVPTHPIVGVSGDEASPRWHGRDPDVLFYLKGTQLLRWVLLGEDTYDWSSHSLSRQIAAVELKDYKTARVVHLAHHRTQSDQYWTRESHAAVNADFTRVAWHTNWYGSTAERANILSSLELPPGFLKELP
jgi:hypothetical protein